VKAELYALLEEANFDPWESLVTVMNQRGERAERLLAHILETKLGYWTLIRAHCRLPEPPPTLPELMRYELEAVRRLTVSQLEISLIYSGRELTVARLIRLSARHSVWHAGQIALTRA
jgi:hypothetical protein